MSDIVMQYCKVCGRNTKHTRPSTSHLLHLVLSIITWGAWIVIWALCAASNSSQAECTECGATKGLFGLTSGGNPAISPKTHLKCPDCREFVLKDARKCKHCGCALTPTN
jgi:rRNA maturation protein Nop10